MYRFSKVVFKSGTTMEKSCHTQHQD